MLHSLCDSSFLYICHLCPTQVRDYSGTYTVKLIPCTTAQNMEYTVPPVCSPREPVVFDLDIRFQQVRHSIFLILGFRKSLFGCQQQMFFFLCDHFLFTPFCRWATQLQWNSVWTLRCSFCQRGIYGSLMAPWDSVRRATWPFLKVCPLSLTEHGRIDFVLFKFVLYNRPYPPKKEAWFYLVKP